MKKTITLNNGVEMPMIGYGVWQIAPAECRHYVEEALRAGYRSIDTAQAYYNEEGVGEAIEGSGIPRGEIFLTTKVWISNAGEEKAARHGRDIAQICLKFLIDEGIIVIPQSTKPERIASNFDLDGFELAGDEREAIRALDTGHTLAADFNDPALAKYLLDYDRRFNPKRSSGN